MVTDLGQMGGGPEKRGRSQPRTPTDSLIYVEISREIGAAVRSLVQEIDPDKPFQLLNDRGEKGRIIKEAVLRSLNTTTLPAGVRFSDRNTAFRAQEMLVEDFRRLHSPHSSFTAGIASVRNVVTEGLTPLMKGTQRPQIDTDGLVDIGGFRISVSDYESHLDQEPSGLSIPLWAAQSFESRSGVSPDDQERRAGCQFFGGVIRVAMAEYSNPYLNPKKNGLANVHPGNRPSHAGNFLREKDLLIEKLKID